MKKPIQKQSNPLGRYAYYSGIGFQMIAIIGVFTFIGYRIDTGREGDTMLWTGICSLVGVCLSLYTSIRMVTRKR